jgi:tetratricopeptide (TPR) repeat protein
MDINAVYLWTVASVTALVAANTIWKLWTERNRLFKDDLTEEDRALAWRVVFFLIFPLVTLLDLRATVVACNLLGGYVKAWHFGLLWYQVIPGGIPDNLLIPVLFAGPLASTILALLLIPPLFFRPHPFLACILGYASVFIFSVNLIVNPILAVAGLGGNDFEQALTTGNSQQLLVVGAFYSLLALIFFACVRAGRVRLWFSELTRPSASRDLKEALFSLHGSPEDAKLSCRIGMLYDKAGLRRQAKSQLKKAKATYPHSLYTMFLASLIAYRQRDYKNARKLFLTTSDVQGVDGELKASLLAAAGCAAFAASDVIGALNLSERALEFDDACLIARMVKVDVFLQQGKREQAGEEILHAMRLGLNLELEDKVPLDTERAFSALALLEEREKVRHILQTSRSS